MLNTELDDTHSFLCPLYIAGICPEAEDHTGTATVNQR